MIFKCHIVVKDYTEKFNGMWKSIDCVPTVTVMLVGSLFLLKTMHSVLVSFSLRTFARIHSQMSDMQVCSFTIAAERASSLSSQRTYTCVSSA